MPRKVSENSRKIWRHNSYFGYCAMGCRHMSAIMESETTTQETKKLASETLSNLNKLSESLKTREFP